MSVRYHTAITLALLLVSGCGADSEVDADAPAGFDGDDLWLSMRQAVGWSTPVNLGSEIHSPKYEYGPALSADGRTLYFTSHRDGHGDLFQIDAAHVGIPVYERN